MILGVFEAIKVGAFIIIGLAIGWAASSIYAEWWTIPAAHEAGRSEERIVHEEQRRKAEAKARADRDATQATIDQVERDYYERDKARVLEMSALEQALQEEQNNVPTPSPADRGAAPVCRPAISRGVSKSLNDIGRARPGAAAGQPDAAVP